MGQVGGVKAWKKQALWLQDQGGQWRDLSIAGILTRQLSDPEASAGDTGIFSQKKLNSRHGVGQVGGVKAWKKQALWLQEQRGQWRDCFSRFEQRGRLDAPAFRS